MLRSVFGALAFTFLCSLNPLIAQADWIDKLVEKSEHLSTFPQCDDPGVLKFIVKRFNWAEKHTWQRGFDLDVITQPRERLVLDSEERLIPRRYCRGHAQLTNGRHPTVFYLIESGQGFAGTTHNVAFCVNGLDPWRTYDGNCRVLNH